ncbi:MAG: DUF433 domain-containing protein [Armatimonadetes bacterium]|nr:DUF433 domain-containing protein [Armatimonadota bacterium]
MSATVISSPIVIDEDKIARIEGSRIQVKHIALDHRYGWSAREIQKQHPGLTLSEIHAALSYYYAHQSAFDAEIERDFQEDEEAWTSQQEDAAYQSHLRQLRSRWENLQEKIA